jgi:membrane protease YdiL (CAAX protease family)
MVLITPLVSFLLEWNMAINVPDWISEYDKKSDDIVEAFLKMNNYWDLVFNIIILAVIPAIGEELLFRGLLQQSLIKKTGNIHIAIFITALIFSAFHLHFSGLFPRILLGLVLGYLFYWSKSLWIPIIAHFLNNAMLVVVSYPDFKSFNFIQNDQHLDSSIVNDTSIYLVFFSFISVMLLMFLFYKNSRIKKD